MWRTVLVAVFFIALITGATAMRMWPKASPGTLPVAKNLLSSAAADVSAADVGLQVNSMAKNDRLSVAPPVAAAPIIAALPEKPPTAKPPAVPSSERPLSPVRAKLAIITRHWHDPHDMVSSAKQVSSPKQVSSAKQASSGGRNNQRAAIE
jgi:hypothetical protein